MKELYGFLNIIKPPGMTSHDLVDEARALFKIRQIGHGGTLDPGAAGILPLAVGKATRLFEYLQEARKLYRGEITLGISTSTQDAQGTLLERKPASLITQEAVLSRVAKFVGEIEQVPPQVSAVRHRGKHSYEWERAGVVVPLPPRKVRIESIKLLDFFHGEFPKVILDVRSSPGMYMRALAKDLGESLGTGAYLSFLVRLESEPFRIEEARTLEEVKHAAFLGNLESVLIPVDKVLSHIPKLCISEQQKLLLLRSNRLPLEPSGSSGSSGSEQGLVQLYDEDDDLVALGRVEGERKPTFFKPVKIFT